jgi:hypothetical protein
VSVEELLREGRLSQACPSCGRHEAAGSYCSGCFRPMTAEDWQRGDVSEAQIAARRANGRSRGKRAAESTKSAIAAIVDGRAAVA